MEELDISTLASAKRHQKSTPHWVMRLLGNQAPPVTAPIAPIPTILPLAGDLPGIPMISL